MHKGEILESHRKYRGYALRYPLFFGIYLGEHIYHNAQMNPAIAVWSKPHSGYAPKQKERAEPKGSMQIRHAGAETLPASSVSPHYKFSNLNAAIHRLTEGSTPTTPNKKRRRK